MTQLTIGEAAAVLHTSPSTIRSWEQRLGYPRPARSSSGRRLYEQDEIALLADALSSGLGISSAIRQIRQETGSYAVLLQQALARLDLPACDTLLESSIAMCGVSRAFDETVLAAVEGLRSADDDPAIVGLAVEWVKDRVCWSRRQAAQPMRQTILVADCSDEDSVTRAASCILQLQLTLRSAHTRTLVGASVDSYRAVARAIGADAIVLVGPLPRVGYRADVVAASYTIGFRVESDLHRPRVTVLPASPRQAADHLLASHMNGAHAIG